MAGTIRAEGGVGGSASIRGGVAVTAGGIKCIVVKTNPVGIQMQLGFWTVTDLDLRDEILGCSQHRDGVAQVTFHADGLLQGVQVFTIMTAEAAGEINVADIIGIGGPIHFLVNEYRLVIYALQFCYRGLD